jgi:hypothetical protein
MGNNVYEIDPQALKQLVRLMSRRFDADRLTPKFSEAVFPAGKSISLPLGSASSLGGLNR